LKSVCCKRSRWTLGILTLGALTWLYGCGSHAARVTAGKDGAEAQAQARAKTRQRMPDFDLKDSAGHDVSSAQFRGKVVLLDFWATWCGPCKKEMPGYERLYRRYKDRGLVVIGISADSDAGLVAKFGRQLGVTYPLLINGMDVQRYGVKGLPTTILVDRDGFVRKEVVGFEETEVFERALRDLL
jgi:peroxiredoxin